MLARVLVLNLIVVAIKLIVGFRTGALSVLGAALESSLDLLNNVVGMVLVTIAARAPDETHPYGHAKFETLGALAIVTFLSISCFELLREAVVRLIHAQTPHRPALGEIALVGVTLAVNAMVVIYERRRGRELSSSFLIADAAHTHSDLYVTLLAIASLGSSWAGYGALDPVLAVLVALIIAWNGYQILKETVPILVDERGLDSADVRRIVESIPQIEEVGACARGRAHPGSCSRKSRLAFPERPASPTHTPWPTKSRAASRTRSARRKSWCMSSRRETCARDRSFYY